MDGNKFVNRKSFLLICWKNNKYVYNCKWMYNLFKRNWGGNDEIK